MAEDLARYAVVSHDIIISEWHDIGQPNRGLMDITLLLGQRASTKGKMSIGYITPFHSYP